MNYNSFNDYLKSLPPNTVFRLWVYKRMFTPYEAENKFSDQSCFESDYCSHVCIKDVIELPDGDLLLALCNYENDNYTAYYKLSEIALVKANIDMEEE